MSMHERMDRSKMRVWMCECDECRMLWIRGVLVRRHPIAVEAPAKLQPFPTLLLPARFSSKAVTDALVSKHVCRAAANCYGKSWTLIAGLSGFLVTVIKCDIQFGFAKSVVV